MALATIEPFGEVRGDLRAGIIASVVANVHRDGKKRPQPYSATDFMPFIERPAPADALGAKIRATLAAFPRTSKKKA
jgi:hypothetical protein